MSVSDYSSLSQVEFGASQIRLSRFTGIVQFQVQAKFEVLCQPATEPTHHASEATPMQGMRSNPDPSRQPRAPYENTYRREARKVLDLLSAVQETMGSRATYKDSFW
ncbi:hypothetical protein PV05_10854 [Exophiala xenobiotica]|uniref:Uncharacterized protein n=1 Tax=Exophiala xenobiotica TaxID=348802 RepID=A0A0D2E321_9EURO|nr:uncharacterized protein PV05_10854 [Exophiala xenobiotica]KIW49150.1 hypothetical protein PV05_10854 [Exophiala xenobiotica]